MFDFTGDATEIGFVEGTTEAEDDPRLALEPASLTIHKQRYSCFVGTGLDDALRARRRYHRGHRCRVALKCGIRKSTKSEGRLCH